MLEEGSKTSVVPYGLYQIGEHKEIHSIDKMILIYNLIDVDCCEAFSNIVDILHNTCGWVKQTDKTIDGYNCFEDKKPSSAYSWYSSSLWLDGINIKFGLYYKSRSMNRTIINDEDEELYRKAFVWEKHNDVKLEFNPNKSFCRKELNEVIYYLFLHSKSCELVECDYSVDYPLSTCNFLCSSKKDKVTYNDSRYFGKRHQHGRLKIYNKRKEIKDKQKDDVGHELTRCEFTAKWGGELYFNQIHLCDPAEFTDNVPSAGKNFRALYKTLRMLQNYGEDIQEVISVLDVDYRSRSKLLNLFSGNSSYVVFSIEIFLKLLIDYSMKYGFTAHFITHNSTIYIVNGRLKINACCC